MQAAQRRKAKEPTEPEKADSSTDDEDTERRARVRHREQEAENTTVPNPMPNTATVKKSRLRSGPATRGRPGRSERQHLRNLQEVAEGDEPSHHAEDDDVGRGDDAEQGPVSLEGEEGRTVPGKHEQETEHP